MSKTRQLADVSYIKSATAPASPDAGDMWYNTSSGVASIFNGSVWITISNTFVAEGGSITTYTSGPTTYKVHTFTTSGNFVVTAGSADADVLMVGGGGGGGSDNAGGGGAGGLLYYGTETPRAGSRIGLISGTYSIVVGAGGTGHRGVSSGGPPFGVNGSNTTAFTYTAIGGGAGASSEGGAGSGPGAAGGSGGGGNGNADNTTPYTPGAGTSGQGNTGGTGANGGGGGGGGAGAVGQNGNVRATQLGGQGGVGLNYSIKTGSGAWYAAGGNGANENSIYNIGPSVNSIGGISNNSASASAGNGVANTGSGGGGVTHNGGVAGGSGGSGIVIIRYAI